MRRPAASGCRANLDGQAHRRAKPSQHIDERVRAEEVDPPTEEIADARLGYTEYLRGCLLLEAAGCDEPLQLDHKVRSDQQMLGLLAAKPEVTEYISAGWCDLEFHDAPPHSMHLPLSAGQQVPDSVVWQVLHRAATFP